MQVDGALVDGRVGARRLDRAEHLAGARVDQRRSCRPRPSAAPPAPPGSRRRARARTRSPARAGSRPRRAPRRAPRHAGAEDRRRRRRSAAPRARRRPGARRRSRGCRGSRIAASTGPAQELVGMAAEELVERVLAGDVDGQPAAAAAGAAPHLPQAGDRAGERDADRGVELADVDPELERVGGDDAEQLAVDRAGAGSPGAAPACSRRGRARSARPARASSRSTAWRRISSTPLRDFMKQIVRAPAATSSANTSAASYSAERAQAELLVEQRRVPHRHPARGAGRRVVVDQL